MVINRYPVCVGDIICSLTDRCPGCVGDMTWSLTDIPDVLETC